MLNFIRSLRMLALQMILDVGTDPVAQGHIAMSAD